MLMQRAFKTKLDPTNKQASAFRRNIAGARLAYNWALADRKLYYEYTGKSLSMYAQKAYFNGMKYLDHAWVCEADYVAIESAIRNLDVAYKNFFRRIKKGKVGKEVGFPRFKSRHAPNQSYISRGSIHIERDRIRLPKIGWARLAESGYLPTDEDGWKLNFVTISERADNWYVSAQVQKELPAPVPATGEPLGVDWGLKALAVCSDGTVFENPRPLQTATRKLKRLQRELSRREKGSENRKKTKARLARQHARVADIRRNVLHNVSKAIMDKQPSILVLEDLNVKGMTANHKLARAIADASPGELMRQFEYKGAWYGVEVMHADRWYASTKTCSACGAKQSMKLSERTFVCTSCGVVIDRDFNAALNLAALAETD